MAQLQRGAITNRESYIFANAAGKLPNVVHQMRASFEEMRLPASISEQEVKSGGMLMGTKNPAIVIESSETGRPQIYVIARAVGEYLYVSVINTANTALDFSKVENIFNTENLNAYWSACKEAIELALARLIES